MRVLVTGGAGFIGSHLCRALLNRGHAVTCYDSLDPRLVNPGTVGDLDDELPDEKFRLIRGDITDHDCVKKAVVDHDAVIHGAAIASVNHSLDVPEETIRVNVMGTLNVFQAALAAGVARVHYLSTDEIWGQIDDGAFTEASPADPRNAYAAGKAGGEAVALAWASLYDMHVTITNGCNTYGPYQSVDKLIPGTIVRAIRREPPIVYGNGRHIREWVHVDDHVSAILAVLDHGQPRQRYCVGTGHRFTAISIVKRILALEWPAVEPQYVPDRPANDRRYALDSTKLRALGWAPKRRFDHGLQETVKWYIDHRDWWSHFTR